MNPTTATTVTTSATTVTAAAAAPAANESISLEETKVAKVDKAAKVAKASEIVNKDGTKVVCGKVVSEDGQITIFENCVVATEPGQNAIMLPEDEKIHPSALALVNSLKATFAKSK
jgi:hypothetical protein